MVIVTVVIVVIVICGDSDCGESGDSDCGDMIVSSE